MAGRPPSRIKTHDTPYIMKLHLTRAEGNLLITGYDIGWVEINEIRHYKSLIVFPGHLIDDWFHGDFENLKEEDFKPLLPHKPEIVLLGTGLQHRFIHPKHTHELIASGIGIECMTTPAACRTYNILMAEDRHVAAALLI